MEYRKIISQLDDTQNQQAKFKTKNWVEINDELQGTYDTNNDIKYKTSMIRSIYLIIVMYTCMLKKL